MVCQAIEFQHDISTEAERCDGGSVMGLITGDVSEGVGGMVCLQSYSPHIFRGFGKTMQNRS